MSRTERRALPALRPWAEVADAVEGLGELAPKLVQHRPQQRLGAQDVRGRGHRIERDRLVHVDQIADPPVAGARPALSPGHHPPGTHSFQGLRLHTP